MRYGKLLDIVIHVSEQIQTGWTPAEFFLYTEIFHLDLIPDFQTLFIQFFEKVNQPHIKIDQTVIWDSFLI